MIEVLSVAGLALVQDRGRFGYAHLGVPRAGVLDPGAATLANRLVGNTEERAVIEVAGSLALRAESGMWVAAVGSATLARAQWLAAGETLRVEAPRGRAYVAVAGGIDVPPVLGSRSTDTLAWVGPPPVAVGMRLPVGAPVASPPAVDLAPLARRASVVRVLPGPVSHAAYFVDPLADLAAAGWTVQPASNRVGVRLAGGTVRRRPGEMPSEGTIVGAIQVPAGGEPVVLLHDHGPTGGYPVAAVVHPADLWQWAQAAPGDMLRLRPTW